VLEYILSNITVLSRCRISGSTYKRSQRHNFVWRIHRGSILFFSK